MVCGTRVVVSPAMLSGVMPCAVMLGRVLRGWIAAWGLAALWFCCALLSRGNPRQENCCRNNKEKTLHWNLPFLNPL